MFHRAAPHIPILVRPHLVFSFSPSLHPHLLSYPPSCLLLIIFFRSCTSFPVSFIICISFIGCSFQSHFFTDFSWLTDLGFIGIIFSSACCALFLNILSSNLRALISQSLLCSRHSFFWSGAAWSTLLQSQSRWHS